MSNSKVFLDRLINFANRMNTAIKEKNKAEYDHAEGILDFTAELATDMGHKVHIDWRSDGQIESVQIGKEKAQAIFYEE